MKRVLPISAKVGKDSKEGIQECVSEFISFITSEASDKCQQEKRKTINGDDILWAMSTLGFDKYVEPLKIYLAKYREAAKNEKPVSTKKSVQRRLEMESAHKASAHNSNNVNSTPLSSSSHLSSLHNGHTTPSSSSIITASSIAASLQNNRSNHHSSLLTPTTASHTHPISGASNSSATPAVHTRPTNLPRPPQPIPIIPIKLEPYINRDASAVETPIPPPAGVVGKKRLASPTKPLPASSTPLASSSSTTQSQQLKQPPPSIS